MRAVVRELTVYPLKSGGGTGLTTAEVTPTGIRYDREFILIRPDGARLSQREVPRMARLRPSYDGQKLVVDALDAVTPLVHEARSDGPLREVRLPRTTCQGVDQGDEAADWFGALLDVECRLVRFAGRRETSRGGGTVAYADGYPLLVISAESLADLNGRLDEPLPMDRFRPSIVVEGLGPFGEDSVRRLWIGPVEIELVRACDRCVITTTDQETGLRGREPLRTLATYRTARDEDGSRGVFFGQNGIPRTCGTIRVGDTVRASPSSTPS
ncbi:MOSC domain-containing protein [Actinoallomurus iriomotensis]|uniref:MOSC domain-containing protein n=1 Tax=Actinoallomurus iriomotensis TaxID=478107 RepID=A0A9W6RMQ0_9ACTN|nr:MOSC N-terminal beta barrel domain-containing protein [Actinoallomurus iriomotensis]GLY78574.1 MOSC domain-containing protein [Actinoallomurus iriomotensis]